MSSDPAAKSITMKKEETKGAGGKPTKRRTQSPKSSKVFPTPDLEKGVPSTVTDPAVGVSRPASRRRSVDLPHPDGPTTATIFGRFLLMR